MKKTTKKFNRKKVYRGFLENNHEVPCPFTLGHWFSYHKSSNCAPCRITVEWREK